MATLQDFNTYGEELEKFLQLRTSPIAIKLLKKEADIPKGAIRPKRDMGLNLALCQAFALSRRDKKTVAMLKEDHWCWLPVIAFGLAEPPKFFLDGQTYFKRSVADLQAAKRLAASFPRLEYQKYIGVVSAPLRTADFEPDLVVIYCNSHQLKFLLSGMQYKEGYIVNAKLDPSGACLQSTVPAILTGECQVTVPCGGDRRRALAQDDEMIFTAPKDRLDDLMLGLRYYEKAGKGYTSYAPLMRPEYPLSSLYAKMAKMVGIEVPENLPKED